MHTCIHAYMPTCIHAYMHTCIHAYIHMCTRDTYAHRRDYQIASPLARKGCAVAIALEMVALWPLCARKQLRCDHRALDMAALWPLCARNGCAVATVRSLRLCLSILRSHCVASSCALCGFTGAVRHLCDVCMYACMHVCMYACMHVCMYACMYVCIHI